MKSPNTKSSDQLKAEVHQDLNKVERSIDNLQRRLSPGQILDDVVFYPHGKSLKGSLRHLKENPVGTAFLSLGTILLMEDDSHHTLEWSAKEKLSSAKESTRENIKSMKESIKNKFPEERREVLKGKAKEKIQEVKEAVKDKFQSRAQDVREKIDQPEENFTFTTEDKKGKVQERAREFYREGKEKIKEMDSLAFLALGAGLGALTGSSVPAMNQEKVFIHERFGDRLSHLGDDLEEAINQSSNILKDLVIQDFKDYDLKIFKE